ncbi:MAG: dockerin type I domain-containing protein [Patescibacteria group bacterium]
MRRRLTPLLIILFFSVTTRVGATDFTSQNFMIKDPVINVGAGFSTSSGFQLFSSLGQEAIGFSSGQDFILQSGFLYFSTPISVVVSTSVPPVIVYAGDKPQKPKVIPSPGLCDFNKDGKCNIVDLSILLFHYGKAGSQITPYDLNKDGKIDLIDISILLYYWDESR